MKWGVAFLLIFGFVAAICASLLVSMLKVNRNDDEPVTVKVVVAKNDIAAMSVISGKDVSLREIKREQLPQHYYTDPVEVAGHVLAVPLVEQQIITKKCFITEGSGAKIAAVLTPGMRAMSIPVSNYSVLGGMLYPGCMVDILVSFKLRGNYGPVESQAISTTLLQAIQVLAVEDRTIISEVEKSDNSGRRSERTISVTLMVDSNQAKALQLAMENGNITLAMKNPLDRSPVDTEATVLNQGQLASLGSLLPSSVLSSRIENGDVEFASMHKFEEPLETANLEPVKDPEPEREVVEKSPNWKVTIIRGADTEEKYLPAKESEFN